jgi:hypothetical protein
VNGLNLDFYGNSITGTGNFTVLFNPSGDATWKSSMTALSGSRFFQWRASFINNAETGLAPVLSALGFAYTK